MTAMPLLAPAFWRSCGFLSHSSFSFSRFVSLPLDRCSRNFLSLAVTQHFHLDREMRKEKKNEGEANRGLLPSLPARGKHQHRSTERTKVGLPFFLRHSRLFGLFCGVHRAPSESSTRGRRLADVPSTAGENNDTRWARARARF